MSKLHLVLPLVAAIVMVAGAASAQPATAPSATPDIPFQKFVLDNGLTLIVHEDHKAPIVAVNVWYHVGSKNEKPGQDRLRPPLRAPDVQRQRALQRRLLQGAREGRRHRPERHHQRGPDQLLPERARRRRSTPCSGWSPTAWATCSAPSTRPSSTSSAAWCRTRSARARTSPTAGVEELITADAYPTGHPYSWTVIGSMEDLNAASLDDVKEWFKTYYGAANAVLVVAGDVKPEDVQGEGREVLRRHPAGPAGRPARGLDRQAHRRAARRSCRTACRRRALYKVWNTPAVGHAGRRPARPRRPTCSPSGKTSRLYKRLVYDDQIATDVQRLRTTRARSAASSASSATARPGGDLAQGREGHRRGARAVPRRTGPTADELDARQDRSTSPASSAASSASAASAASPTSWPQSQVLRRRPGRLQDDARAQSQRRPPARAAGRGRTLALRRRLRPRGPALPAARSRRRRRRPLEAARCPARRPTARFPAFERATLAQRPEASSSPSATPCPVVQLRPAGRRRLRRRPVGAARHGAASPSTCSTRARRRATSLQISDELAAARRHARHRLRPRHRLRLALARSRPTSTPSLDLFADVVLQPVLPARPTSSGCKKQQLAAHRAGEGRAQRHGAARAARRCSTARATPTRNPLTGSGTEASVGKLTRDDAGDVPRRPGSSRTTPRSSSSGDTTLAEIQPEARAALRRLEARRRAGEEPRARSRRAKTPTVYLIDRPGAAQSVILAGHARAAEGQPGRDRHRASMNAILGGTVHLAHQHEPARGQALVLRRPQVAAATPAASARSSRSRRCRPTRPRSRWPRWPRSCAASSAPRRSPTTSWPRRRAT